MGKDTHSDCDDFFFYDEKCFGREDKNLNCDNDDVSGKGRKVENVDVDDKNCYDDDPGQDSRACLTEVKIRKGTEIGLGDGSNLVVNMTSNFFL